METDFTKAWWATENLNITKISEKNRFVTSNFVIGQTLSKCFLYFIKRKEGERKQSNLFSQAWYPKVHILSSIPKNILEHGAPQKEWSKQSRKRTQSGKSDPYKVQTWKVFQDDNEKELKVDMVKL